MSDDVADDAPDEGPDDKPADPFAPYRIAPLFHAQLRFVLEELYHQGRLPSWPPSAETVDRLARQLRFNPNSTKKAEPVFGVPDETGYSRGIPPDS